LVVREPALSPDPGFTSALAEGNPIGMLLGLLTGTGEEAKAAIAALLRALIEEGVRFATTPAGTRWARILADAPAVNRGWLLWSHSNVDMHLRNAAVLPDNPGALLEAMLRELSKIDLAKLTSELSRLATEINSTRHSTSSSQS
jgi:hypothetical protein